VEGGRKREREREGGEEEVEGREREREEIERKEEIPIPPSPPLNSPLSPSLSNQSGCARRENIQSHPSFSLSPGSSPLPHILADEHSCKRGAKISHESELVW